MAKTDTILDSSTVIYVPEYKFLELGDALQVMNLVERKGITQIVFWKNTQYVATGAVGSGNGKTWEKIQVNRTVKLEAYKGDIEPLEYSYHDKEIESGRRERGYNGLIVKYQGQKYVLCEPYTVKKLKNDDHQIILFQ